MSSSGADLSDPQLIRAFHDRLARFLQLAVGTLGSAGDELARVRDWLEGEQTVLWTAQRRKREDACTEARRRFQQAQFDVQLAQRGRGGGKQSSDEERLALRAAQRRLEEAEEKLALIRTWVRRLQREGEPLMRQVRSHGLALQELGAPALERLTDLADTVQAYLDVPAAAPPPAPPTPERSA